MGFDYVHSAVDDHTRLAYSEIHPDEKVATRAATFFHRHGITRIERVLTDNACAYRKGLVWKAALADLGTTGKLTRAYRPRSNGKLERFKCATRRSVRRCRRWRPVSRPRCRRRTDLARASKPLWRVTAGENWSPVSEEFPSSGRRRRSYPTV